jgi:hypothetical protein
MDWLLALAKKYFLIVFFDARKAYLYETDS